MKVGLECFRKKAYYASYMCQAVQTRNVHIPDFINHKINNFIRKNWNTVSCV